MSGRGEKTGVRVSRELVQAIHDRQLQEGDRYLSEAEALAGHGVSRATYREALRFLEFQGALTVKAGAGGGAVVARPDWRNLASAFALLSQLSGITLAQVMEARRVIEPAMAAQSASHASPAQLAHLRELIGEAQGSVDDADAFLSAYRRFWHCVADATGNPVTAELWKALRALIDTGRFVPNEVYRGALLDHLEAMLAAMKGRDEVRAAEVVAALDAELSERLARDYPVRLGRTIAWSDVTDTIEAYAGAIRPPR